MTPVERIDALMTELAELRTELTKTEPVAGDWLDQHQSVVGPRRHIALCRARMARGEPGATQAGRRYLLTRDALAAELDRSGRARSAAPIPAEGPSAELRRELALLPGGRR